VTAAGPVYPRNRTFSSVTGGVPVVNARRDPEIIVLRAIIKKEEKMKEINASKIYSPVGKCAILADPEAHRVYR